MSTGTFTIAIGVLGQENIDRAADSIEKLARADQKRIDRAIAMAKEEIAAQNGVAEAEKQVLTKRQQKHQELQNIFKQENNLLIDSITRQLSQVRAFNEQFEAIARLTRQLEQYSTATHRSLGAKQREYEQTTGTTRVMNEQALVYEKLASANAGFVEKVYAGIKQQEHDLRVKKQAVDMAATIAESMRKAELESKKLADATYQETLRMEQRNKVMRDSITEQERMARKYEELRAAAASYAAGPTKGVVAGSRIIVPGSTQPLTPSPADMALQEQYTKLQKDLLLVLPKLKGQYDLLLKTRGDEARGLRDSISAMTEAAKVEDRLAAMRERTSGQTQKNIDTLARLTSEEKIRTSYKTQEYAIQEKIADLENRKVLREKGMLDRLRQLTQEERTHNAILKQKEDLEVRIAVLTARKEKGIQDLIATLKRLEAAERGATNASAGLGASLGGVNQLTASMRAGMTAIGAQFGIYTSGTILAAGATYGFVNAIKQVVVAGKDFQVEIARVNAVMNLSEVQVESLKETTIGLAASSRYTAKEVAQAFREMGMAGIDYQNSMAGIRAVLSLASIGSMDFAQATDIATNVTFGFGLEMSKLSHVVDVMAKTVTSSNQDIKQLGNTMSYAAPIASSFGVSLELTAAMTEILANSGIKASRAGTTLRRTFTALFSDTERVTEQLGELGVRVNFLASDMDQELLRVLQALNAATNGATINVGNLTKAVGLYAAPGFLKLVKAADQSKKSLEAIYEATKDVEGAAYEMQKRIEDTLAVDWDILKSALEAVKVMFFELYEGGLRDVVQSTSAWIQGLAANKDLIKEISNDLKGFTKTVGMLFALIAGSAVLGGLFGMLKKVWDGLKMVRSGATATGAAVTKLGRVFGALRAFNLAGLLFLAGSAALKLWDAFKKLEKVEPVDVGKIRNFKEAQKALSGDLGYEGILQTNEGMAVAAAQSKLAIDELVKQRAHLEEKLEMRWAIAAQAGIQGLSDSIGVLDEQISGLSENLNSVGDDYILTLDKLARAEVIEAQELLVTVRMEIEANQPELERLEKQIEREVAVVQAKLDADMPGIKRFREIANNARELYGFKPKDYFLEALRAISPAAAEAHERLVALRKEQEVLLRTQQEVADLESSRRANKNQLEPKALQIIEAGIRKEASAESDKQLSIMEGLLSIESEYRDSVRSTDDSLVARIRTLREQTDAVEEAAVTIGMDVFAAEDMFVRLKMLEEIKKRDGGLTRDQTTEYAELTKKVAEFTAAVDLTGSSLKEYEENIRKIVDLHEKLRSEIIEQGDKWFMFEPDANPSLEENARLLREVAKERRALDREADAVRSDTSKPTADSIAEYIKLLERLKENEAEYNKALERFKSDQAETLSRFKELKNSTEEYAESQMTLKDALSDISYFEEQRAEILSDMAPLEHRASLNKLTTDQLIELAQATDRLGRVEDRLSVARAFRLQQEAELNARYAEASKLTSEQIGYTRSLSEEVDNLSAMQERRNSLLQLGAQYQELYDQGFGLSEEMAQRRLEITIEQERVTNSLNASQSALVKAQGDLIARSNALAQAQEEVNEAYKTFAERGRAIAQLRGQESALSKQNDFLQAFLAAKPQFMTGEETLEWLSVVAQLEKARAKLVEQTDAQTEAEKALREELTSGIAAAEKRSNPVAARPADIVKSEAQAVLAELKVYEDIIKRGGALPGESYDKMQAALILLKELLDELTESEKDHQDVLKKGIDIRNAAADLLEAQGRTYDALQLRRRMEIEAADEEIRGLIAAKHVAEDQMKVRQRLIELYKVSGNAAAAERLERKAAADSMSAEEYALESLARAYEKNNKLLSMTADVYSALGKTQKAAEIQRRQELSQLTESEQALTKLRYAVEDLDRAREEAASRQAFTDALREEMAAMEDAADYFSGMAERGLLQEALLGYDATETMTEIDRVKAQGVDMLDTLSAQLEGFATSVGSTIKAVFGEVMSEVDSVIERIKSGASEISQTTSSTVITTGATGRISPLLNLVGQFESKGDYDAIFSGAQKYLAAQNKKITEMTIRELLAFQKEVIAKTGAESAAAGKYQYLAKTLASEAQAAGIDFGEKFSAAVQDRLATYTLSRLGVDEWLSGAMETFKFADKIAGVWAAFPHSSTGKSLYSGVGSNKELITLEKFHAELERVRQLILSGQIDASQAVSALGQMASEQAEAQIKTTEAAAQAVDAIRTSAKEVSSTLDLGIDVNADPIIQYGQAIAGLDKEIARLTESRKNLATLISQGTVLSEDERKRYDLERDHLERLVKIRELNVALYEKEAQARLDNGATMVEARKLQGAELAALEDEYNTIQSQMRAYNETQRETASLVKSGSMLEEERVEILEKARKEIIKSKGAWHAYYVSLKDSLGTLKTLSIDVFDKFRQALVDGLAEGKLEFGSFVDYIKKRLIELAVNTIVVNFVGNILGVTGASAAQIAGTSGAPGTLTSGGLDSAQSLGYLSRISSSLTSNSIGEGVALAATRVGGLFGRSEFASAAYGRVAAMPNWQVSGAGMLGGIAGGYLAGRMFEGEYVSIGSTIGSAVGAAAAPMIAGALGMGPVGWAGLAVGAFLGAIGGGGIGSLFGGKKKEDPRITLGVNNGTMGIIRTNGQWKDNGDLGPVMKQINEQLDELGNALGQAARDARASYRHSGQELRPGSVNTWINDVYADMVRAMVDAAKGDALANAGSALLGDILAYAFELAGDDPGQMLAAIALSNQMHDMLYGVVKSMFDLDFDPVISDADQGAEILWNLAKNAVRAGEGVDQALGRVVGNLQAATLAFDLVGQSLSDIQLSPEELFKTIEVLESPSQAAGNISLFARIPDPEEIARRLGFTGTERYDLISPALDHVNSILAGADAPSFEELQVQLGSYIIDGIPNMPDLISPALDHVNSILAGAGAPSYEELQEPLGQQMMGDVGRYQDWFTRISEQMRRIREEAGLVSDEQRRIEATYEQVALTEQEIAQLLIQRRAEIGENLAEYAGGMEILQAGMATYYENFYSEAERQAKEAAAAQRSIEIELGAIGFNLEEIPETREDFRALVESIDLTTDGGQELFATLMKLSGAFNLVFEAVQDGGVILDEFFEQRAALLLMADRINPRSVAADRDAVTEALVGAGYTGDLETLDAADIAAFMRDLAALDTEDFDVEAIEGLLAQSDALNNVLAEQARRRALEIELLNAQGRSWEATLAQRELEIQALSEEEAALTRLIWASEDAARVRGLEIELLNAQGRSWEATLAQRELEIQALSEEEAALTRLIWASEDAARAFDLQVSLLEELGDAEAATQMSRHREVLALSETEAALQSLIWALQDAKAAAEDAYTQLERSISAQKELVEEEYEAMTKEINEAYDSQMEALQAIHDARMEALDEEMGAAQESLSELSSIVSTLESAVKQLKGSIDELAEYAYFDAQKMVRSWAASGLLPGSESVEAAASALTGDVAQYYSSQQAYERDQLYNLASLEALLDLAETRKSEAELVIEQLELSRKDLQEQFEAEQAALQAWRDAELEAAEAWRTEQIEALDLILENARNELDALLGIDNTLLSVDDAMSAFDASLAELRAVQEAAREHLGLSTSAAQQSAYWLERIYGAVSGESVDIPAAREQADTTEETEALRQEIVLLRTTVTALLEENVRENKSSSSTLRKWDYDGLPTARETVELEIV